MSNKLLEVERLHLNELRTGNNLRKNEEIVADFIVKYTYESVTIDNKNTMTKSDIAKLITTKTLTTKYCEREQKEVLNHVKAFNHVINLVNQKKWITEDVLKDLHEILVEGIFVGGTYRKVNVQITDSIHQPPNYIKVYDRMKKYIYDLDLHRGDVIQKAALAHAGISKIYPFLEGNGRLARLVMNYVLLYHGYIPISFSITNKGFYFEAINDFKTEKSLELFCDLITQKLLVRYEDYIKKLEEEQNL